MRLRTNMLPNFDHCSLHTYANGEALHNEAIHNVKSYNTTHSKVGFTVLISTDCYISMKQRRRPSGSIRYPPQIVEETSSYIDSRQRVFLLLGQQL